MASIKLKGDVSGEVTIQAPSVAGTTTYNLSTAGGDVLATGDIGTTVQGYDADTAKYDDTTANFTGTLQNNGNNVLNTTSTLSSSNLSGPLPAIDGSSLTGVGNETITLSGDVSGSGTTAINVTVADDSHNHIISNVDGLQSALDSKVDSGNVVQVVQSYSSSPQALGANAWRDIGGLNLTITPQSTANKILLLISFNGTANDNSANTFRLLRSGTQVYGSGGTNGGFRTWGNASYMRPAIVGANFNIYDSPNTTSARNYKVQGYANNTFYINRNYGGETLGGYYGTVSMIALEIKG